MSNKKVIGPGRRGKFVQNKLPSGGGKGEKEGVFARLNYGLESPKKQAKHRALNTKSKTLLKRAIELGKISEEEAGKLKLCKKKKFGEIYRNDKNEKVYIKKGKKNKIIIKVKDGSSLERPEGANASFEAKELDIAKEKKVNDVFRSKELEAQAFIEKCAPREGEGFKTFEDIVDRRFYEEASEAFDALFEALKLDADEIEKYKNNPRLFFEEINKADTAFEEQFEDLLETDASFRENWEQIEDCARGYLWPLTKSQEAVGSFQAVYDENKENFKTVINKLDSVINGKRKEGFFGWLLSSKTEQLGEVFRKSGFTFDPKKYKANAVSLFFAANDMHEGETDLRSVINELCREQSDCYDAEFAKAWKIIQKANDNYYFNAKKTILQQDKEYVHCAQQLAFVEEIKKSIDRMPDSAAKSQLLSLFEKKYGTVAKDLSVYLHDKEKAQFNELILSKYRNQDTEFDKALEYIESEMARDNFDLNQAYLKDRKFADSYELVAFRTATLAKVTNRSLFKKEMELKLDAAEYAKYYGSTVGAFVKNHPAVVVGPSLAFLAVSSPGWVPYAVGGIAAYHVAKKAAPVVSKELEKAGFYYDIKKAVKDREIRSPYIQKIFSIGLGETERVAYLKKLHNANILFKEDLEGLELTDTFKAELKKEGIKIASLPSLQAVLKFRHDPLVAIKEFQHTNLEQKHVNEQIKNLTILYNKGMLYKEDIDIDSGYVSAKVVQQFFVQINEKLSEEDKFETLEAFVRSLPDVKAIKHVRNRYLTLALMEPKSDRSKIYALTDLHDKGLLFKEDIQKLKKLNPDLLEKFLRSSPGLKENNFKPAIENYKEKSEFKQQVQEIRKSIIDHPGSVVNGQYTEQCLSLLHRQLYCFKEDWDRAPPAVQQAFEKSHGIKRSNLPSEKDFYKRGFSDQAQAAGKAMVNLVWNAPVQAIVDDHANIAYGPLVGVKNLTLISVEALEETFETIFYAKPPALKDRLAEKLPSNVTLKRQAAFATNKVEGKIKSHFIKNNFKAAFDKFPLLKYTPLVSTSGTRIHTPKGGLHRALNWSKVGAMGGSVIPIVAIGTAIGLGAGGVIAGSLALSVFTCGIGLIIPLVLLGSISGYFIAGLTGKALTHIIDPVEDLAYKPLYLEADAYTLRSITKEGEVPEDKDKEKEEQKHLPFFAKIPEPSDNAV